MILDRLDVPVVLAPLAGGPSTPELAAAVTLAGGLGFLAAGYLTPEAVRLATHSVRRLADGPFGVNVFVPGPPADTDAAAAYAGALQADASAAGVALGRPRHDDDAWEDKIDVLAAEGPPVVSFTFGCPPRAVADRLRRAGSEIWVTVTTAEEAVRAVACGADAVIAQGGEAGGHRAVHDDDPADDLTDPVGLLSLLQLVTGRVDVPVVAAGGIMTGAAVAAVLVAGASAAQLGTAFLRCPEAGTSDVHRRAVAGDGRTGLTRAFTGRLARGIRNGFLDAHTAAAPAAYPQVHHVTAPLRQAGRAAGDPDLVNLWAGQAHPLSRAVPAADLVRGLHTEARAAMVATRRRWPQA